MSKQPIEVYHCDIGGSEISEDFVKLGRYEWAKSIGRMAAAFRQPREVPQSFLERASAEFLDGYDEFEADCEEDQ